MFKEIFYISYFCLPESLSIIPSYNLFMYVNYKSIGDSHFVGWGVCVFPEVPRMI